MIETVLGVALATLVAGDPATSLTIGSPAPKLPAVSFVKGEPVKELAKGTVYVIEFSGIDCVPCHRVIPLLTELQKAHADVIVISIYGDEENAVREFLSAGGQGIAYRVVADPPQILWNEWHQTALLVGIPQAFVVDRAGKVAWIGHPVDLADPLARIVAGTFDPRADMMRLKLEQGAIAALRRLNEREEKAGAEFDRINALVIAGKLSDALTATERALVTYDGCPQATNRFRRMKMYLLANLPGAEEQAVMLATELAIEARLSERWVNVHNTAKALLNAAARKGPLDRDQRLVDLAIALLRGRDPKDLRRSSVGEVSRLRTYTLGSLAWAYHLRGDQPRAVATIREALAMSEQWKLHPEEDENDFAEEQRETVNYFRECLGRYEGK